MAYSIEMNYQYIEQLLERYWECQTTLEEEQILRSFFRQQDVPDSLKSYADYFSYEEESRYERLSEEFDERILAMTSEELTVKAKTISLSSRLAPLFKAAAVVAVVLTIGNVTERALQSNTGGDVTTGIKDTYTKKEDITATIQVIDHSRSEAIAKTDSLNNQPASMGQTEMIK